MDIVNIYYECLNKSYKDDSLEPLLNSVYKIINYYDWELTEIMGIEGDTAIYLKRKSIILFTRDLFSLIKYLIKFNNYENFDEIVEFLYEINIQWNQLINALKSMYCPDTLDIDDYYHIFRLLCNNSHYTDLNKYDHSLKITEYLRVYKEFYNSVTSNKDEFFKRIFFQQYSPMIMGELYKANVETIDLYKAFDYLLDNYKALSDFIKTNDDGNHQKELTSYLIDRVLNNYLNNNYQIIKD